MFTRAGGFGLLEGTFVRIVGIAAVAVAIFGISQMMIRERVFLGVRHTTAGISLDDISLFKASSQ